MSVEQEAVANAARRALHAEAIATATGRMQNPEDAIAYLGTPTTEAGDLDRHAFSEQLDELLTRKPYLAPRQRP